LSPFLLDPEADDGTAVIATIPLKDNLMAAVQRNTAPVEFILSGSVTNAATANMKPLSRYSTERRRKPRQFRLFAATYTFVPYMALVSHLPGQGVELDCH
jgi:hypothetical protein